MNFLYQPAAPTSHAAAIDAACPKALTLEDETQSFRDEMIDSTRIIDPKGFRAPPVSPLSVVPRSAQTKSAIAHTVKSAFTADADCRAHLETRQAS
jgi:hypothetical protein